MAIPDGPDSDFQLCAVNLIRNRKGNLPHIMAVTAEPLPMRIASLALGTGDLDCVYHFALDELREVCETLPRGEDQLEMLETMIQGNRLRDISDLPSISPFNALKLRPKNSSFVISASLPPTPERSFSEAI